MYATASHGVSAYFHSSGGPGLATPVMSRRDVAAIRYVVYMSLCTRFSGIEPPSRLRTFHPGKVPM